MFRGVRGAITVKENNEQVIFQATDRLFKKIIHDNQIEPEQVASVFISVTDDITEAFPAKVITLNGRLELRSCHVHERNHSAFSFRKMYSCHDAY